MLVHATSIVDTPPAAPLDTEAVYREHGPTVARCLRRLGVRPEDRDDVLQDVFVVVHRNRARFEGRSSVGTWVYGIAVRVAIAHLRRTRGRAERADREPEVPLPSADIDPQGAIEQRDAAVVLDGLLAELDDDKRAVFVLSELEDIPVPRIAETLSLNVRTTYSRLRAARADFERGWVRWQARTARVERRVPIRDLAQRTSHERVPAWAAIAIAIETPVAPVVAGVSATGGTTWLAIGVATLVAVVGVAAITREPPPRPKATTAVSDAPASAPGVATAQGLPAAMPSGDVVPSPAVEPPRAVEPIAPRARAATRPAIVDEAPARAPVDETATATPTDPIALLRDARAALRRGDAAASIAALREHERRAPASELTIERETLWVEAACATGDRATARAHAQRWAALASGDADTLLAERCR